MIIVSFVAWSCHGQEQTPPPASLDDVNGSTGPLNHKKYVAPDTLANRAGAWPINAGPPNLKSNQVHLSMWALTNGEFATTWKTTDTNGWLLNGIGRTNGNNIFNNTNVGAWAAYPIRLTNGAYSRFRMSFTIPSAGVDNNGFAVGFWTNILSGLPDTTGFVGFGPDSTATLANYHLSTIGVDWPSWGTRRVTNATYNVCISSDPTNLCWSVVYPGHSNEVRAFTAWSAIATTVVSNFGVSMLCFNPTYGPMGGRAISFETISPRTNIETSDFVIYSQNAHVSVSNNQPDLVRISLPAQMDSGTNLPDLLLFVHGNGGGYADPFDALDAESETKIHGYYNAVNSNNFIVASYQGDFFGPGRLDTWGTSNSQTCIDALLPKIKTITPYRYLILECASAGGASGLPWAASHHEVKGVILDYAIGSITNRYGGQKGDIDLAYLGVGNAGEFQTTFTNGIYWGDPGGIPPTAFSGISFLSVASYGDNVVVKSNQSDLILTSLGGIVGTSNALPTLNTVYNTPMGNPEVTDYGVNGPGGSHGGGCYSPAANAVRLAFLSRVRRYAAADVANLGGDFNINGTLNAGALHVRTNALQAGVSIPIGDGYLIVTNQVLVFITKTKTNSVSDGR